MTSSPFDQSAPTSGGSPFAPNSAASSPVLEPEQPAVADGGDASAEDKPKRSYVRKSPEEKAVLRLKQTHVALQRTSAAATRKEKAAEGLEDAREAKAQAQADYDYAKANPALPEGAVAEVEGGSETEDAQQS